MSSGFPRLITVTMPAKDSEALAKFYTGAFGIKFGRTIKDSNRAFQAWASAGVKWNIGDRYHESETTMMHIAVDNLATTASAVVAAGGKVMTPKPVELKYHEDFVGDYKSKYEQFKFGPSGDVTESLGSFHVCCDPQGNRFGIVQLEPWAAKLFSHGEISKLEAAEQVASLGHAEKLAVIERG